MSRSFLLFVLAFGVVGAVAAASLPAAARTSSESQEMKCINLMSMGDTPIIDDHTILVKMRAGKVHYKRIDLAAPCPDIGWEGFSYTQDSYDELCTANPLKVRAMPGEVCKIADINDISDTEAKQLLARKDRK
jgi:hypothetical protein